jgi:hypothetical protein
MRRRTAGLIVAVLVWGGSTMAGAQTTTTSTSSSTTGSSTTSTSAVATTSTTLPNPCAGQPCIAQPPDAFVSGVNGEVRLDRGSFCWSSPTPGVGLCATAELRDPDAVLVVRAGETLGLRFAIAMSPTFVRLERGGQTTALTPGNPVRFGADLPVGSHVVRFSTGWLQGDMGYSVRLDVRATGAPATPTRGRIALTG